VAVQRHAGARLEQLAVERAQDAHVVVGARGAAHDAGGGVHHLQELADDERHRLDALHFFLRTQQLALQVFLLVLDVLLLNVQELDVTLQQLEAREQVRVRRGAAGRVRGRRRRGDFRAQRRRASQRGGAVHRHGVAAGGAAHAHGGWGGEEGARRARRQGQQRREGLTHGVREGSGEERGRALAVRVVRPKWRRGRGALHGRGAAHSAAHGREARAAAHAALHRRTQASARPLGLRLARARQRTLPLSRHPQASQGRRFGFS
jgi:hypothetical protein